MKQILIHNFNNGDEEYYFESERCYVGHYSEEVSPIEEIKKIEELATKLEINLEFDLEEEIEIIEHVEVEFKNID